MNEKALHTLEYDKILLRLTALAGSEGAKTLCRDLRPMTDPDLIRTALQEIDLLLDVIIIAVFIDEDDIGILGGDIFP